MCRGSTVLQPLRQLQLASSPTLLCQKSVKHLGRSIARTLQRGAMRCLDDARVSKQSVVCIVSWTKVYIA